MSKYTIIYFEFVYDVACQKLVKSANVSRIYSKNNTGNIFFQRRGVFRIQQKIPPFHHSFELTSIVYQNFGETAAFAIIVAVVDLVVARIRRHEPQTRFSPIRSGRCNRLLLSLAAEN